MDQVVAIHNILRAYVDFFPQTTVYGSDQQLDAAESALLRQAGIVARGVDAAFRGH